MSRPLVAALWLLLDPAVGADQSVAISPPAETWIDLQRPLVHALDEARAKLLYDRNCRVCHGAKGRGDGAVARYLEPKPRDLTRGVYKFRSTPSGSLPTDQDLFNTLSRGLPGTAMLSWRGLSPEERWQLVWYMKTLSPRFGSEPPTKTLDVPAAPPATPARIANGRAVWIKVQCQLCHGDDGRGWGPAAKTSKDDKGQPSYPFNLTRSENFRSGRAPEDLYRTLFTGLDGTAMPSYSGAISQEEAWNLVHYVRSLFADNRSP